MATIQELFDYARLANAAYVNLSATNWANGRVKGRVKGARVDFFL